MSCPAFNLPATPHRLPHRSPHPVTCSAPSSHLISAPPQLSRRAALLVAAGAVLTGVSSAEAEIAEHETETVDALARPTRSPEDAQVTEKVYFDMKVAGKPVPRIVIGLFGEDAPVSVASFMKICSGALRGRGGRTIGYAYSQVWKVEKDVRIDLGRVKQVDEINQSPGTAQRQIIPIQVPENSDANDIGHLTAGTVSVKKGGGAFEFVITPGPGAVDDGGALEAENIVIGRVLEGMDTVDLMNNVPTNQKTSRDGFRKVGKVIGDGRAKLDLDFKPLQKISVSACGVL